MRKFGVRHAIAGIAAALAIAAIAIVLFGPLGGHILERIGVKLHHPANPPPIAKGVNFAWPGNWNDNPQWNAVLARRFPAGTDEAFLRLTLFSEGFQIDEASKAAKYEWGGMPCLYTLKVNWQAADGKIKTVNGGFGMGCL